MTKKGGKSIASTKLQENTSVKEDNSALKKPRSEIDEIFGGKKRKKTITEKTEKPSDDVISRPKKTKKKKDVGFEDDLSCGPRKKMQDSLAIYTEEELGINKEDAGGTPLCPFDCSCCF